MIDLHIHTTYSDGNCTPEEVVHLAKHKGLKAIAITDHDSVSGIQKAVEMGRRVGVEIVPGIELSAKVDRGILHILGYFINPTDSLFRACLAALRDDRSASFLRLLGDFEVVRPTREYKLRCGIYDGKPQTINMFQENTLVTAASMDRKYYPKANVLPQDAVRLIKAAGGIPILAHPYSLIKYSNQDWDDVLLRVIDWGIEGIEVFYPAHTPAQTGMFLASAREHNLVVTGGSDFHGRNYRRDDIAYAVEEIGNVPGWDLDYSLLDNLRKRARLSL